MTLTPTPTSAPAPAAAARAAADGSPGAVAVPLWLGTVMGVIAFPLFAVPVVAPMIAAETGIPPGLVGLYSGTIWLAAMLTAAYSGRLIARWGAWPLQQVCLLCCAIGVAMALFGLPVAFVFSAIIIGLGHGLEAPTSSQLMAARVPAARRSWLFSVKQSGAQVGGMLASALLPLLAVHMGWRATLVVVMAMMLTMALLLLRPRRRWPSEPVVVAANTHFGLASLLRAPGALRRMAWASAAFAAMQICFNSFFVTYAVTERGDALEMAGRWLAAGQFGGLLGRLFWGWASSRFGLGSGLLRGLGFTMALCGLTIGAWGEGLSPTVLLPLLLVFGFTANGWNGVFFAEVARLAPPTQIGAVTGAVMSVMTIGLVAGPLLFAGVAALGTFGIAFMVLALISGLGAVLLPRRA